MPVKLRMMPHTVPNSPTNGATEPTVARMFSRSDSRSISPATAAPIAVASRSRVPPLSIAVARGRAPPFGDARRQHARRRQLVVAVRLVEGVDVLGLPEFALEPRASRARVRPSRRQNDEDDRPGPDAGEQQPDHHHLHHPVGLEEQRDRRQRRGVGVEDGVHGVSSCRQQAPDRWSIQAARLAPRPARRRDQRRRHVRVGQQIARRA